MRILIDFSPDFRATHMQYCRDLIMYFVDNLEEFYGETFPVYNVHCLVHLPDDSQHFKESLDEISAFPFENHQKIIKKYVKNFQKPIIQVAKREQLMFKSSEKNLQSYAIHVFFTGMVAACS